jgi:hypothetical protein
MNPPHRNERYDGVDVQPSRNYTLLSKVPAVNENVEDRNG